MPRAFLAFNRGKWNEEAVLEGWGGVAHARMDLMGTNWVVLSYIEGGRDMFRGNVPRVLPGLDAGQTNMEMSA